MSVNNQNDWCFAWFGKYLSSKGKDRAGLAIGTRWTSQSTLRIAFLDGEASLHERVKNVARQWTGPNMANLEFYFTDTKDDAIVRISFVQPDSASSLIGNTCTLVTDSNEPTMHLGRLKPDSTDELVQRTVLHEFGHVLGLIHEHQSPAEEIDWNREAVTEDLKAQGWSTEQIEENMFDPMKGETNYTLFDRESIMLYPIPARWTNDGFSIGWNTKLSSMDKKFIRGQYQ